MALQTPMEWKLLRPNCNWKRRVALVKFINSWPDVTDEITIFNVPVQANLKAAAFTHCTSARGTGVKGRLLDWVVPKRAFTYVCLR